MNFVGGEPGAVPLPAQGMVTRWAFEALMVAHFRYNSFLAPLLKEEAAAAEAEWELSYRLPRLQALASRLERKVGTDELPGQRQKIRALIERELTLDTTRFRGLGQDSLLWSELRPEKGPVWVLGRVGDVIGALEAHYHHQLSRALYEKDSVQRQDRTGWNLRQQNFNNEAVEWWVTQNREPVHLLEDLEKGRLWRLTDAVFLEGGPQKMFAARRWGIDVPKVNLGVIWGMNLLVLVLVWLSLGRRYFVRS
jgi:hypothetical protein